MIIGRSSYSSVALLLMQRKVVLNLAVRIPSGKDIDRGIYHFQGFPETAMRWPIPIDQEPVMAKAPS